MNSGSASHWAPSSFARRRRDAVPAGNVQLTVVRLLPVDGGGKGRRRVPPEAEEYVSETSETVLLKLQDEKTCCQNLSTRFPVFYFPF